MTSQAIARGFLTLPGRQVHYRRAGSGPPVVLLHQSPKTSEELVPLIAVLAEHFTVFAPDTPGYGLSDPIAAPDKSGYRKPSRKAQLQVLNDTIEEYRSEHEADLFDERRAS